MEVFPDRHAAYAQGFTQCRTGMEFTIGKMMEELTTQLHARKGTTPVTRRYPASAGDRSKAGRQRKQTVQLPGLV
jgi:hypothetical protein